MDPNKFLLDLCSSRPDPRLLRVYSLLEENENYSCQCLKEDSSSPDSYTRAAAAWALKYYPSDNNLRLLRGMLCDEDEGVRVISGLALVEILSKYPDEEAIDSLLLLSYSQEVSLRLAAVTVLGDLKAEEGMNRLSELLLDKDSPVRAASVWALSRFAPPSFFALIASLWEDEEESVRAAVAEALGQYQENPDSFNFLERLIIDSSSWVRGVAIKSLRNLKDPRVIKALEEKLDDKDLNIHHLARESLAYLHSIQRQN